MRHVVALVFLFATAAYADPIVIRAPRVLDGRGHVLRNAAIVVDGGKIVGVELHPKKVDVDLANATMMPSGIDTHVHIGWRFDADGRSHPGDETDRKETPEESALYAAGNAFATLMGGITTMQSLGAPVDRPLRAAIERGVLPGPRILTALLPLSDEKRSADAPGHRRAGESGLRQEGTGAQVPLARSMRRAHAVFE